MKKISRLTALLLALLIIFQMTAVATEVSSEDIYVEPTPIPQENLDADILMQLSNDAAEVAAAIDTVRGMGVTANQDLIPIRNYPNLIWGEKIAELPAGTFVVVYDTMGSGIISGDWYKVCYNGQDGYIHSSLLNVCSCNVQEGAGLDVHADGCPDKMYYTSVCALTAAEIYANWANYTEAGQSFVLSYLGQNDAAKLAELTGMIYLAGVPACDCGNDGNPLSVHSDGCARKAYFKSVADEKTAEEIYADWANCPADGKEYIIYRLTERCGDSVYAEKLAKLNVLIGAVADQEIEDVLPGGNAIQLSGAMPEDANLESSSVTEEAKNYVLENLLHSVPVNRESWKTFAYDLKIMSEGVFWQPTEDGIEVTIGGIGEGADQVEIIHLLDSEEAIEAERAAGRLLSYTAEDIPSGFEAETTASGVANLIYYAFVSPDKVRINEDGSVTFTANSFSKYIFSATVNGTSYTYEIGDGDYMLASILKALNVGKTVDDVKCTIKETVDATNGVRSQTWTPDISTNPANVFTFTSQVEKLDNPNPELTDEANKIFVLRDYRLARTDTGKKTDSIDMTINFKDDSSITINIRKAQTYNKWPTGTSDNGYNAELSAANGIPTFEIFGEQTYEATTVSSSVVWVLEQGTKITMLGSVDVSNNATVKIMGEGTICNAIGTEAANYGVMFDLSAGTTMNVVGEGSGIVFDGQSGITVESASDNKDKIGKYSGVAIKMTSATLAMNNAAIKNMYNTYSSSVGTGIHCIDNLEAPNNITLTDVEVSNCLNRTGHSVLLINGFVKMTDCSFINNCNNSDYAGIIKASGGQFCQLVMEDCKASGNYSEGWGGLILWAAEKETTANVTDKKSWAKLDGCEFSYNSARYLGGAISNEAVMELKDCYIHHNTAAAGGGIAVFPFTLNDANNAKQNAIGLTLGSGNVISDNTATATAAFFPDFVVSTNDNVSYPVGGGGIWYYMNRAEYDASLDIGSGNVIKNNTAASGGGIYVHRTAGKSAVLNIEGATITGNTATYGGGVALVDATLNVSSGKIDGNTATDGGGVYIKESDNANFDSMINVSGEGSISDNVAKNNGGGVYVTNGAEMKVNGGLIITNKAGKKAGEAGSEHNGSTDSDGFSGGTVAADAGNRVGGGVYVGKNSSFIMQGTNIGIFKNKAAVAADDVYASGEGTSIVLPAVDEMTLTGQFGETEKPTGWFEDYMPEEENYGSSLNDNDNETPNTGRYRYADFTHMVADKATTVKSNQFACITLGLMKMGTGSLTITKSVIDEDNKSIDSSDQVFVFKVQETNGSSYTFFTTITGSGQVTINEVPTGEYTVTELVEWAGRYTNTVPGEENDYLQTVIIKEGATDALCNFINRLDEDLWLDDNTDVVTNTYNAASAGEGD